jgi:hypothetical protein
MSFTLFIIAAGSLSLIGVYLAYRGVRKGTAAYHKRGIVCGGCLLLFWAALRVYFYLRYQAISLEPVYIPVLALTFIASSTFQWLRLSKEEKRDA